MKLPAALGLIQNLMALRVHFPSMAKCMIVQVCTLTKLTASYTQVGCGLLLLGVCQLVRCQLQSRKPTSACNCMAKSTMSRQTFFTDTTTISIFRHACWCCLPIISTPLLANLVYYSTQTCVFFKQHQAFSQSVLDAFLDKPNLPAPMDHSAQFCFFNTSRV